MDALAFSLSIKEFADEYLGGLVTVEILGDRPGNVKLNMPAVSYLIRLITMITDDDEIIAPLNTQIRIFDRLDALKKTYTVVCVNHVISNGEVGIAHKSLSRAAHALENPLLSALLHNALCTIYAEGKDRPDG